MVIRGEIVRKKVSELMDGELESTDAVEVIGSVKSNSDLLLDWKIYHTIRDVLHQADSDLDVTDIVRNKLIDEPLLMVPDSYKKYQYRKQKLLGFSIAASVAVLSIGWLVFQAAEQQQHEVVFKEVYVAEKANNKVLLPVNNEQRALVNFQPSPLYTLPAGSIHNNYHSIHRGVTYENSTHHYPATEISSAIESTHAQQQSHTLTE